MASSHPHRLVAEKLSLHSGGESDSLHHVLAGYQCTSNVRESNGRSSATPLKALLDLHDSSFPPTSTRVRSES